MKRYILATLLLFSGAVFGQNTGNWSTDYTLEGTPADADFILLQKSPGGAGTQRYTTPLSLRNQFSFATDGTGLLPPANGGLGVDVEGYVAGIVGVAGSGVIDIDTLAEFDSALGITGTPTASTVWYGDNRWGTVPTGGLGTNLSSATDDILSDTGLVTIGGTGGVNNEDVTIDGETTANTIIWGTSTGVTTWDQTAITLQIGTLDATTLDADTFLVNEKATSSTVAAGDGEFWVKSDAPTTAWFTDDTDVDFQLTTLAGTETLTGKTIATGSNTVTLFTEKHAASHTLSAAECYGGVYYVTSAATLTLPAVASGMSITVITIGAVAVSVDSNASDLIMLDGTALDDGDKVTNLSTTGDLVTLTYYDATGWYAATNSWTDGGP